jgi:ubiquinone/menaquinone biosynthesis C-methylase UbiE
MGIVTMSENISGFRQVDTASEPQSLVAFLDHTAEAHFAAINQRSLELLALAPGQRVLEVGCGTGDEARRLRRQVGEHGSVTAIDLSEHMLCEAKARDAKSPWPTHFQQADVQKLPFAERAFEATRVSRVLLHVPDVRRALREVLRVTVPGGRIALIEPDFDTLVMSHPDRDTTRYVVQCFVDSFEHGDIGRWLPVWLQEAGLTELVMEPRVIPVQAAFLRGAFRIGDAAERAARAGHIGAEQARQWLATFDERAARAELYAMASVMLIVGRLPPAR